MSLDFSCWPVGLFMSDQVFEWSDTSKSKRYCPTRTVSFRLTRVFESLMVVFFFFLFAGWTSWLMLKIWCMDRNRPVRVAQTSWWTVGPPCTSPSSLSSSCCQHWEGLSLKCVSLCAVQRGDQVGSSMLVSLHLPTWRRWCRSEWTLLGSPVEIHLKDSVHWSVAHLDRC